jgi:porphyrinogen peroxidase
MDLCFEIAAQIMVRPGDSVSVVDEVLGFRYFDDRDLLGFVDGTENPRGPTVTDAALIGEEDAAFLFDSAGMHDRHIGRHALETTVNTKE